MKFPRFTAINFRIGSQSLKASLLKNSGQMKNPSLSKESSLDQGNGPMRFTKTFLVLLILLSTLGLWVTQQENLREAQRAVDEAEAKRLDLNQRIALAAETLETIGRE